MKTKTIEENLIEDNHKLELENFTLKEGLKLIWDKLEDLQLDISELDEDILGL